MPAAAKVNRGRRRTKGIASRAACVSIGAGMTSEVDIQPVAAAQRMQAMEFVLAGDYSDVMVATRAEALYRVVSDRAGRQPVLLSARRGGRCVAAAMVVPNPGRVGMLMYSPPGAQGVAGDALVEVVRAAARAGLRNDLALVQALVEPDRTDEIGMLASAGLHLLATLVHMTAPLRDQKEAPTSYLAWRNSDQYDEAGLERVIADTYTGSLDCPALSAVRGTPDVIECHKATGIYHPRSWWIVDVDGAPAGCVLMNDSALGQSAEIVYLGVVPPYRGRGLGRAMLRHAAADARARGMQSIELAVDDANTYAKAIYASEGYRPTRRQNAYVMFQGDVDRLEK